MLAIELNDSCNFKCYFCGARNIKQHTSISTEMFKKLIDSACSLGITYLKLTPSNGEIFMDNEILQKLKYAESSTIKYIRFHTNFSLVTPKIQEELKKFKKIEIHVSDYGLGDIDKFKYLTRVDEHLFNKVQSNLEYARQIRLNVIISPRDTDYDFSFDNSDDDEIEEIYRISKEHSYQESKKGVCSLLYIPRILSNGDFSYCTCAGDAKDLPDYMIIGNIYNTPFEELYLHQKRLQMINDHKKNNYCEYCRNCDVFGTTTYSPNINVFKNLAKIKKNEDT